MRRNATAGKGPTQRQLKVGEEIRHALARILPEAHLRDPELQGAHVTVTQVRMSPDLRHATAFVTRLGGGDASTLIKALNRAAPYLRGLVVQEIVLKWAPQIVFAPDVSFDRAGRIDDLLRSPQVMRDLDKDDGEA